MPAGPRAKGQWIRQSGDRGGLFEPRRCRAARADTRRADRAPARAARSRASYYCMPPSSNMTMEKSETNPTPLK